MIDFSDKIREILPKGSAALIYTETARRYITGFDSSLGYVFILPDETVAFFDGRYIESAKKNVRSGITVRLLESIKKQGSELLKNYNEIYIESANSFNDGTAFANCFGKKIIPQSKIDSAIASLREVKTEEELQFIKAAQSYAESAFNDILKFIKPGVTEKQIAAELEYKMKLCGSDDMSFQTIAITGKKTSMPHGVPDETVVKCGDFVTLDFGATCNGYHSDMTRTVAVKSATDEMKKIYSIVLEANLAAEAIICDGVACSAADNAARSIIENAGYGKCFNHSTGHGVGLEIHEAPNLSYNSKQILRDGQVVTVEPGIYLPENFGVRTEDMLYVTKNGSNNLTKAIKSLIIL